jgi:hypothetical protein
MIKIYTKQSQQADRPEGIDRSLAQWGDGQGEAKLVMVGNKETTPEERLKLAHDLKAAKRTLTMAAESLKNGYKFDDAMAQAKSEAIQRAVDLLGQHIPTLVELIEPHES